MTLLRSATLAALGLALASCASAYGTVIYVNAAAGGANTGASWADAFVNLQSALTVAAAGDEVWVAAGTYRPAPAPTTPAQGRDVSFALKNGVALYGGFVGNETNRTQRDWTANLTTLSGDLLGDDGPDWTNRTDNSYHVVTATNVHDCTVDGFTISGGYADGPSFGANPESKEQGSGANVYYATPRFENDIFEKNWAANHGAFNDHGGATVAHCTFRNNYAQTLGAGLYMHNNAATRAITCTFTGNSTPEDGAGAYSRSQVGASVSNSTFTQNTANQGAGMFNAQDSTATISGCTFTSNLALLGGGGVFAELASPTVNNCVFTGNHAAEFIASGGGGGGGSGGGGFWATGGSPTVTGCTFTDNVASFGGGVYFNEGSTGMVQGCVFTHNNANEAGGLYMLSSSVTVRQCTFTNNTASGGSFSVGGGVSNYFSDSVVDGCILTGNHAFLGGGGMYSEGAEPIIMNSTFTANATTGHEEGWGGGLLNGYFTNSSILNCTFVGNTGDWGGGIANAIFSNPLIAACTFSGNTSSAHAAAGGAIQNFDQGTPTIVNVIAWQDFPGEIGGTAGSVQFSCIQNGRAGLGNFVTNPRLTRLPSPGPDGVWGTPDDDAGDLRLQPGSPCIDAGNNAVMPVGLSTDLAGQPRYLDDPSVPDSGSGTSPVIDLGAFEFQGISCSADFDGDGDPGTDADIEAFFACLAGNCCPACAGADFNHDGDAGTDADIESFFRVLAGGPC